MTVEIDRPATVGIRHDPAALRRPLLAPSADRDPGLQAELPAPAASASIEVTGPDLRQVFEEAGSTFARRQLRPEHAGPAWRWENVYLRAVDVTHLAGLWLDRLVSLGDSRLADDRREAVVAVAVDVVSPPEDDAMFGRWQLRARVGLRPFWAPSSSTDVPPSPLDQPISVEPAEGGWRLRALLAP